MLNFIRTTILGGIVFLLPFAVLAYLLGKTVSIVKPLMDPIASRLPFEAFAGYSVSLLLAILVLVLVSFLAGVMARTPAAQRFAGLLEASVLGRVPGYNMVKTVSQDLVSPETAERHQVVLVRFDDSRQLGVKLGEVEGGAESIVFLPDSPTPQTGTVMIVASDRLTPVELTLIEAYSALARRGYGLAEQLRAAG